MAHRYRDNKKSRGKNRNPRQYLKEGQSEKIKNPGYMPPGDSDRANQKPTDQ